MLKTENIIDGHIYDAADVKLPSNDDFRSAWVVPENGVVQIDPAKKRLLMLPMIRVEAQRRISALVGARDAVHLDVRISNASREAIRLLRIGADNWTAEEAARAAQLEQMDLAIEAIRAASNTLEADPPDDFADDKYWP